MGAQRLNRRRLGHGCRSHAHIGQHFRPAVNPAPSDGTGLKYGKMSVPPMADIHLKGLQITIPILPEGDASGETGTLPATARCEAKGAVVSIDTMTLRRTDLADWLAALKAMHSQRQGAAEL